MIAQTSALDWPQTFFIDGYGEAILPEQVGSVSSVWAWGDDGRGDAVERGFIEIRRCGRDVLIFLQPDRVDPITLAGAIDVLARLGQEWTIVCPTAPGERLEWFSGCTGAIHKITSLLQEAGRLPNCADSKSRLADATSLAVKHRHSENVIHINANRNLGGR